MSRRQFLVLFSGVAAIWPFAPRAQNLQARPVRIGILRSSPTPKRNLDALRRGLSERGYVEGRGYAFVYRFGEEGSQHLAALAIALVADAVDVIVTEGLLGARAARAATDTIPIVMTTTPDPVRAGLVASLARPGGNITGLSSQPAEIGGKLLELLKEIVPKLNRFALIMVRPAWDEFGVRLGETARKLGLDMVPIELGLSDIDGAMRRAASERAQAAAVIGRPHFSTVHAKLLVERASAHRIPTIYESREFVEFGGLVAYGVDVPDLYRRAAIYVDKVLKGAKPAELPIEQPTKFEMVINLKTAKTLGLPVSDSILLRADEVIE